MMAAEFIWMLVSQDKYELPLVVASSAGELARKLGKNKNTIESCLCHYEHGRLKKCPYVRVKIDDTED